MSRKAHRSRNASIVRDRGPDRIRLDGSAKAALRRVIGELKRQDRELRAAAKAMPKRVPWAWAEERLLPLLAGPNLDPKASLVTVVGTPGCAVVFGFELGLRFVFVDAQVAERWECTATQLHATAMANLHLRAAELGPNQVSRGTLSGRVVRFIDGDVAWVSSLLLVPDELTRLFGADDQIFAAPGNSVLISLPIDTPARVVADIVVDMEMDQRYPLMLEPFVLLDGSLHWQDLDDESVA